ncbi:flagellar motor switch protein FliG [Algiphilus sp.]|uniref:flagellar motor switch protein FliG n=2 Tax=Algiphilus sp. TaxID=1872431 RepID=UPI0025C6864E|nr:flagellar motor switch protein FliG [Algiphilus sp.]
MVEALMERPAAGIGDGTHRAAVLLLSLGEAEAAEVLKHMSAREVQKLGAAMARMGPVTTEQAQQVISSFVAELDGQTSLGVGADEYVRRVLANALGEDKAGRLIDRILVGSQTKGLDALKWMDARAISDLVRNEHPQIVAIVLAYLEPDQAAEVLGLLSERTRADVVMRIATLEGIPPNALNELDEIMERQFSGNNNLKSSSVGGVKVAASILNFLDSSTETQLIEAVRDMDATLSERIEDLMFVFDDLATLDDRSIQRLLREVPGDKLPVALKGADARVREKITANISKRAAEMLLEDLEARGPVKVSDVEAAQKEILALARQLSDDGELTLGSKGGADEYV